MAKADPTPSTDPLATPLAAIRGVGPERSAQMARLGLLTVRDLLHHRPRRYEDRRRMLPVAALQLHQAAAVRGKIVAMGVKRFAQGRKSLFELIVDDGSARLHCRWWNLPYMQNYFQTGDEVLVFGKPIALKPRTIDHPETEVIEGSLESSIHLNRVAPVYPLTEGLPQRWLRSLIWNVLTEFARHVAEPWPAELMTEWPSRAQAIQSLHFPEEPVDAERARQRLALDELIELQLAIQGRRQRLLAKAQARPCPGDNRLIRPFLASLPFRLTEAQTRVLRELRQDMSRGQPMRRLLQGDVGCGKTVVAACCALLAIESGFNVALMAPTEILAEQHFRNFIRWFEPLGVEVRLQTGTHKPFDDFRQPELLTRGSAPTPASMSNPVASRQAPSGSVAAPRPTLAVGTHALIEDAFGIENLGLVMIDEQHRFGVAQREKLVRKGQYPHLLVMTATPIPRTMGLTLYGDLDISVIDQLPSGRASVRTFVRPASSLPKVWAFIRTKLTEGRQAFVVMPRVEDSGPGIKAVTKEFALLEKELAPHKIAMLHGRLSAEQKETTMNAFRAGAVSVLLSTSLVEVGIDVPNASIMLIENAEQFGLAQLHQLRGRIGRGAHESYCILVARAQSTEAQQRLQTLAETTDGFRIAEADLNLRGPGDLLGHEQSGMPPLRFAELALDLPLVERARTVAAHLLGRTPIQG